LRYLVVEDNVELRETLALLLEAPGRHVDTCASGEQALELFERSPYEAVLADVGLPGVSGIELARRLRLRSPDTWLVLCSGALLDAPAADASGRTRVLTKPFSLGTLEALLAEIEDVSPRA
jgi:DNA-binding response OmpR family regulator